MRFVERIVENVCYRFAIPDGISQADIDVKIQSTLQDKKLLQTISLTPTVLGNNITVTRLGTDTYVKQAMLSSSQAGGQVRSQIRLLLDQITYDFNRVLTWLIGRQLPASDAKLQEILFAMQLFKNEDADLLGRFFPERAPDALSSLTNDINSKLPFSAQLSNWCTFLRSSVAYWEESTYKQRVVECLPQLDKLYIFQKQVEHLKECSNNNSRASARNKLQHTLTKEVGSLKENQSTLLPGGVWQEEKGYITPMIYQVTRLGSENHGKGARYKVKVFDPAGLLSTTSREQELIEKEFSEGELYQFIKTSTIVLSGAKKTHLPSEKASITSVLTNMLTSKLKEYFFGKDEFEKLKLAQESKDATTSFTREKALQESFSIRSSSVSKEPILRPQRLIKKPLMHLFLKELKKQDSAKESLASEKSLFQASLLLSIHKKYQHELSQVEFRTWVRQNALTLLSSLEKQKKTLEAAASPQRNQITAIVQGLEVILQKIDTLDKQLLLPLPDKSQSSNLSKAFQEPFCPTHKLFQSVKRSISQQAISKELLLHKEEASSAILTTQQLEKALLKVEKALGQGYFLEAHYSIKNLYLSLERNQNEPYVKELSPKTLLELQKLLLRTSWGEHKKAPSALDFRFILLSIKLQFEIAKPISPPDISFFEEIAKDHYFSQADSASKIQEYFRYFNTIPSDVKQSPFDIPFDNGKIENTVISELQQTLLLSAVFVAPERTLQLGQMSQIGKVGVRLSSTVQGSTIEELNSNASKLWHPLQLQVVLEELTSRRSNISFKFETSVIDGKPAVLLMPAGLRICDPQDDLMQKGIGGRFDQELPHLFKAQRLELPEDLSKHVFQQVVSENAHHAYGYDDQGKAIERKPIHFKNTPGNYSHFRFDGRTEQQILESDISILNLPTDSSKELQLIMSDPHRTRIEALISFLNKNISTFNDLKTGGALERLLETILLRDGALFHLEKGEKAVLGIYSSLAKLAAQSYRTGNYRAFCHIYKVFQLLPKRPDFSKEESLLSTYFNERIKQKAVPERRQILECYLLRTALEFDATGSLPENSADLLEKINEYRALPATRYEKDPQVEERIQELGLAIAPVEAKIELLPQKRGMVFAKLPPSIYLAPYFKTIQRLAADSISNIDLLGSTWMRREIISPFTAGEYTLKTTSHLFRIIADNEGNIRFLKRQRGGWLKAHRWYHYQPSLFEASQSKGQIAQKSTPTWQVPRINPHSSSQQDYWITLDGKDLLIEEKGVPIWRAMLDSRSSTILSMKNEKEKRVLFNTSTNAFFQRFRDIEHDAFVVSTGDEKSEQVTKVAYRVRIKVVHAEK